jgi:SAM-dependent methyltransferase
MGVASSRTGADKSPRTATWSLFEDPAEEYDEGFERNRAAYLSEVEALRRVTPRSGKGLEIGAGTGRFAQPLGVSVGVDPSVSMPRISRARGVRVVLACGESFPLRDRQFDWVLMVTTLCFVASPEETVKEAERTVRRYGKTIAGIIDRKSALGRYYQRKRGFFFEHAHLHSTEEVVGLLRLSGLRDTQTYQTVFGLPERIEKIQEVKEGYGEGGFVVVSGGRR